MFRTSFILFYMTWQSKKQHNKTLHWDRPYKVTTWKKMLPSYCHFWLRDSPTSAVSGYKKQLNCPLFPSPFVIFCFLRLPCSRDGHCLTWPWAFTNRPCSSSVHGPWAIGKGLSLHRADSTRSRVRGACWQASSVAWNSSGSVWFGGSATTWRSGKASVSNGLA